MTTYIVTMNDAAKTDISVDVDPDSAFVTQYGLVQAIIEATHAHDVYKALRKSEDATIRAIWIDGEEITQF